MMNLSIPIAAKRIASELDSAERLANETLRATAALQVSMMNLRIDGGVAPYESQMSVLRVQQAQAKIVEAQSELAKAHKTLRADFEKITMVPDTDARCPVRGLEATEKVA